MFSYIWVTVKNVRFCPEFTQKCISGLNVGESYTIKIYKVSYLRLKHKTRKTTTLKHKT